MAVGTHAEPSETPVKRTHEEKKMRFEYNAAACKEKTPPPVKPKGPNENIIICDKFRFDEYQLQVGDIIQKPNGTKYLVVEQNIDIFCIRHLFQASELKQVLKTYLKEIK